MSTPSFRDFLFAPDHPRVADIRGLDAREYAQAATTDSFAGPMIEGWKKLYPRPFVGITSDGQRREGLYPLVPARTGEEAPTAEMVAAAEKLLAILAPGQAAKLSYPVDAPEWQSWANPEFMQHDTGLRLDELEPAVAGRRPGRRGGEPERRGVPRLSGTSCASTGSWVTWWTCRC